MNDCDRKESDELNEVNDNTNDNIRINGKAEEHPSAVESDSNSKLMENKYENRSSDAEVTASSVGENDIHAK